MAPKSHFPRIVLVKSLTENCVPALKECVGRYTHIQSFNGILLDGLDMSDVTDIIQSATNMSYVQLVVRYVHPIKTTTYSAGLMGNNVFMSTPVTPVDGLNPAVTPVDGLNPAPEALPIPLVLMGDVYVHCKELFKYLSGGSGSDKELGKPSADGDADSQLSGSIVVDSTPSTGTVSLGVPMRHLSRSTSHPTAATKSDASASSSHEGSDTADSVDKYVRRLPVSRGLFATNSLSSPSTTPIRMAGQHPYVDKRYILSMFTQAADRKFAHLFLRASGLYLVVISLEDLVEEPMIQFENLSFWLRLVQTYIRPSEFKRVMIVGVSDGPVDGERERECLRNLEGAIEEYEHVYHRDRSYVIPFNRKTPKASLDFLCQSISRCMETLLKRGYHMHRQFFEKVFQPFPGLTRVLSSLSHSKELLMSPESLLSIYQMEDLHYFDTLSAHSSALISDKGEGFSLHATWILIMNSLFPPSPLPLPPSPFPPPSPLPSLPPSLPPPSPLPSLLTLPYPPSLPPSLPLPPVDSLLNPGFLIDLLKKLSLTSAVYKDAFTHNIPMLQSLPVVVDPWPKSQIAAMHPNLTQQQVASIFKWAEDYELFYSLGYSGYHQVYFIPLLATEFLAEDACYDWPFVEEGDCWFDMPNIIILYAKLNFSAIDHFFYAVLTEILRDIVDGRVHSSHNQTCYIRDGCTEAIMPIRVPEGGCTITVYMKYHLLQNVIEFRTK